MNVSEGLLVLLVALFVFGPNRLPMVVRHLGALFRRYHAYKRQIVVVWERYQRELECQENTIKAQQADATYQKDMVCSEDKPEPSVPNSIT